MRVRGGGVMPKHYRYSAADWSDFIPKALRFVWGSGRHGASERAVGYGLCGVRSRRGRWGPNRTDEWEAAYT